MGHSYWETLPATGINYVYMICYRDHDQFGDSLGCSSLTHPGPPIAAHGCQGYPNDRRIKRDTLTFCKPTMAFHSFFYQAKDHTIENMHGTYICIEVTQTHTHTGP
jgi:hypothetical protein